MRYAVPVSDGRVALHFGHCEEFGLFDADVERRAIVRKEFVPSPGHQPGLLPAWLAEEGASVVIAKGMGSRAQNLFAESRIQVVIGAVSEDPEQVVLDHMHGALEAGDNICDH